MKSYNIYSNPHFAYTIGLADVYDNQRKSLTFRKVGYQPVFYKKDISFYIGGIVFENLDEAKKYLCSINKSNYFIYKILLPVEFSKCVRYSQYKTAHLLYDALIVEKIP